MTAPAATPIAILDPAGSGANPAYRAGACNIGAFEIRRRRTFGILGFAAAAGLLAALVASGAPVEARAVLFLPLAGGFSGWLQARRRFCAGFAFAGIANFGADEGGRRPIADPEAVARDRAAAYRLGRDVVALAALGTVAAVLLPL